MLLVEPAHPLLLRDRLLALHRFSADVLHLIVRHLQPLSDRAVGGVLARGWRGPRGPEPQQQHRLSDLGLMLLGQLRKTTILLHHFI